MHFWFSQLECSTSKKHALYFLLFVSSSMNLVACCAFQFLKHCYKPIAFQWESNFIIGQFFFNNGKVSCIPAVYREVQTVQPFNGKPSGSEFSTLEVLKYFWVFLVINVGRVNYHSKQLLGGLFHWWLFRMMQLWKNVVHRIYKCKKCRKAPKFAGL